MGFKVDKNLPPLEREFHYLLHDLCVDLGFCIPPEDWERITRVKRINAEDFAVEVVRADGLNPEYEQKWVKKIAERFLEHFGKNEVFGN